MKATFGNRICVIGPSGSGKSTFADKLSKKLNFPVLHIDQIAHIPHTNWVLRPREETQSLHDVFIEKDKWVIDGLYSRYLPQRLKRADTVVLIHKNRFKCLVNFLKRQKLKGKHIGALEGAPQKFNFRMIGWILFKQPRKWNKQLDIINQHSHLNVIHAYSFSDLDHLLH